MMRALTAREQNLIMAAVTLVFCTLFIVYLILPLWQNYDLLRVDLDNTTAGWNKLQAQKKAGAANQDIQKIESEVKLMRKQIPATANTADMVYYLNQAAGKAGVSLDGLEVMLPQKRDKNQTQNQTENSLDAKVTVTGNYGQIRNFVAGTEGLTRLTHNRAVSVIESHISPGKLESTIEFKAFLASRGTEPQAVSDVPRAGAGGPTPFRF